MVNLCFGHGFWRYLKRSKPTSLVLVTWFFQTWAREDFACVLSGVFASVFVWYFCVEKERTLRYPWHEINHSGTSDFIQLFNADLVWSLTTFQSCQNPLQRSKWRLTCMEGSKGSAESFRGLNIEKKCAKVERDDNGARLNISMSIGSRIVFGTKDKDWLDLLWEAGLQVTIQVRLCSGPKGVLVARNVQSEAIKALGHPALSDSFVSFAKTVLGLGVDKVKDGEDLGLSFNGTSYNAAMRKAALSLGALFPSPGLEAALQHLELEFGREVVSNEYSKLSKLIAVTKQSTVQSPDSMSTSTLADKVSWLVEMLSLAFKLRVRPPSKATDSWQKNWCCRILAFLPACFGGRKRAKRFNGPFCL